LRRTDQLGRRKRPASRELHHAMGHDRPSSPWQKGTVENTNRRARRWLPRKRNTTAVPDHELKMICDRLNATPRKCLGYRTPAEVFESNLMEIQKRLE
ncbi:transposase, partial [Sulfitobacter sp. 1A13679]|uniref:transposase n=1 Tax=Sulfitobacter sp. 1A13679 TaxID=3368597 RepID=UPI003746C163